MTLPVITLMSGIQTQIDPDICFTLDSTDLGVLDTDILAGTEDTEFVAPIRSLSISRGRSRQLDRFNAGSALIVFDNSDRKLDPLNTASTYAGYIVPRLKIQIFADDVSIFCGFTTDWEVEYEKTYNDVATVKLFDAFTILQSVVLTTDELPQPEDAGKRLEWVDLFAGYDGATNFSTGVETLGGYALPDEITALDYMLQVAQSDRGFLFIDSSGVLTFISRNSREAISELTFADDGSGIPYMSLIMQYNDEQLYNQVIATSPAGTVVVQNDDSISQFGLFALTLPEVLNSSTASLIALANSYLDAFSNPVVRFTGLSVELAGLSSTQIADLLALEIADQVSVKKSFQIGEPLSTTQDLIVTGISHQIRPGSHVITFNFESTLYKDGLVLDDAVFGKIDDSNFLA